jgi:hypothetical protein
MRKTDVIINPQGKRISNVPKVEPRSLLPCSTDVTRGSTLGFYDEEPPTEILIETLAELIVEAFFYERNKRDNK